jgi:hypothetical protein
LDTNYTSTSFSLRFSQRIGYRLTAGLTLAYEHAAYDSVGDSSSSNSGTTSSGQGSEAGRVDDLYRISFDLSAPITQRWTAGLTLSAYKNESNTQPFESYQAILQTSYAF